MFRHFKVLTEVGQRVSGLGDGPGLGNKTNFIAIRVLRHQNRGHGDVQQ